MKPREVARCTGATTPPPTPPTIRTRRSSSASAGAARQRGAVPTNRPRRARHRRPLRQAPTSRSPDRWFFDRARSDSASAWSSCASSSGGRPGCSPRGAHGRSPRSERLHQRHRPHRRRPAPRQLGDERTALALITAGEGLHNNHHDAPPTSARFARTQDNSTPGWWGVRLAPGAGAHPAPHGPGPLQLTPPVAAKPPPSRRGWRSAPGHDRLAQRRPPRPRITGAGVVTPFAAFGASVLAAFSSAIHAR